MTTTKRKNLVLFTNSISLGKEESLLVQELPVVAKSFERVVIVSSDKNEGRNNKLPENCQPYNCPLTKNPLLRLKLLYLGKEAMKEPYLAETALINQGPRDTHTARFASLLDLIFSGEEKLAAARRFFGNFLPEETVLYSCNLDFNSYIVARLKKEFPKFRAVCRVQDSDLRAARAAGNYLPLTKYLLAAMDQVVVSSEGQKYLQKHWSITDNLIVSHLATMRQNNQLAPVTYTMRFKRPGELLSVGNLSSQKQVELIIRGLVKSKGEWNWTHIGDGPEMARLADLAEKTFARKSRINWCFMGALEAEEILEYYVQNPVDCFISTVGGETAAVSMMEALSFGVPVIAPAVSGITEIVDDKVGHLLSAKPTAEEIGAALDKMAAMNVLERSGQSLRARKHWLDNFDANKVYADFVDILRGYKEKKTEYNPLLTFLDELPDVEDEEDDDEDLSYLNVGKDF